MENTTNQSKTEAGIRLIEAIEKLNELIDGEGGLIDVLCALGEEINQLNQIFMQIKKYEGNISLLTSFLQSLVVKKR